MAIFGPFYNASVTYAALDISNKIKKVLIKSDRDVLDQSAMGSIWEAKALGKAKWSVDLTFNEEIGTSMIDGLLWASHIASTTQAIIIRPDSAVRGVTNPEFTGNVVTPGYEIGGNYGSNLEKSITLQGTGALARATS